jgi:hypothetical protein
VPWAVIVFAQITAVEKLSEIGLEERDAGNVSEQSSC